MWPCLCVLDHPSSAASSGHTSSAGSRCGRAAHSWGAGSGAVVHWLPEGISQAGVSCRGHEKTWASCPGGLPLRVRSPAASLSLRQMQGETAPGKPGGGCPDC